MKPEQEKGSAPDPAPRDDSGHPLPPAPSLPGQAPEAGTWGGEGGAGGYPGGPVISDRGRRDEVK